MNINSKMFGRKIDLTTFVWTAKLLQKPIEAQGKQLSLADGKCENGFAWVREGADAHYKVITKQNYLWLKKTTRHNELSSLVLSKKTKHLVGGSQSEIWTLTIQYSAFVLSYFNICYQMFFKDERGILLF